MRHMFSIFQAPEHPNVTTSSQITCRRDLRTCGDIYAGYPEPGPQAGG